MTGLFALLAFLLRDVSIFVSHVKNNNFPQPLSSEAESELLERWSSGDTEARNTLIEHNLRLVAHVAKKFTTRPDDADDFISIGTIGLIKAVESYHPNRGTKLATYAARCIENEILMHLRSSKKHRKDVYLSDRIGIDKDGNELTIADLLGSDAEAVEDMVDLSWEKQKIFELMPSLPEREREVLCKRYGLPEGEERTQREIAKELGISRSYVSRIEHRALTTLYQHMHGGTKNSAMLE